MAEISDFLCYLQPSRPGIQPSFVQIPTSAAQSTFDSSRGVTSPRGGLVHCLFASSSDSANSESFYPHISDRPLDSIGLILTLPKFSPIIPPGYVTFCNSRKLAKIRNGVLPRFVLTRPFCFTYQEQPFPHSTLGARRLQDPLARPIPLPPPLARFPGTSSRTMRPAVFTRCWSNRHGIPSVVARLFRKIIKRSVRQQVLWEVQQSHGNLLLTYR